MYRGLQPSNMCKVSFVGARQRTRGCSPRGLGGVLYSSKGYKRHPAGLPHWGGRPASFSAGNGTLSAALGIPVLVQRLGVQLNHQAGAR